MPNVHTEPDVHIEPGLRALLATHTHQAHEALHHHPRLVPLASGAITRAELIKLLADYRIAYGALEAERRQRGWWASLSLHGPLRALDADLASLVGVLAPPHTKSAVWVPPNRWQCLGALYVMLGAQFGGRVLGKVLASALPGVRSTYFAPCPDSMQAWRDLLVCLDAVDTRSDAAAEAALGAELMFGALDQFLSDSALAAA